VIDHRVALDRDRASLVAALSASDLAPAIVRSQRSVSHRTVMPVGRWRTWTALSVFCRCCPPLPDARHVEMSSSRGSIRGNSISLGSASTATVTVLVWTRPRFSFGGTRCQRCPPASSANVAAAPLPLTRSTQNPARSSTISMSKQPPAGEPRVDRGLHADERLRVVAAFRRAHFEDQILGLGLHRIAPSAEDGRVELQPFGPSG
jgi:hypothetical protein